MRHRQATRYRALDNNRAQRQAPRPTALAAAVAGAAAVVVAALAAGWAWGHSERAEVSGDSMVPTLQPGDRLVIWRTKRFRPGDIVAAADPRQPTRTVLKRAATVGSESDLPRRGQRSAQHRQPPLRPGRLGPRAGKGCLPLRTPGEGGPAPAPARGQGRSGRPLGQQPLPEVGVPLLHPVLRGDSETDVVLPHPVDLEVAQGRTLVA